jgi:alkanesulfonate monooxygenase SsuD/methylene tetrahydromethanopterin reductase-like flavin-dependent oxidoreductase (luciferase family)
MTVFTLRYDLRAPAFAKAPLAERVATALEQCAWADRLGFAAVSVSEHHGSDDGFVPSPLTLAAAIAARTQRMRIQIGALITPLYDLVRLAEDVAYVDVISGGRIAPTFAAGYVASEFESFGRRLAERRGVMDELVPFLKHAWTGEPFRWRGRRVRVTPRPAQRPHPPIVLAGSSVAAAKRAARVADGFAPSAPELYDAYLGELRALGKPEPKAPPKRLGLFVHVAEDPEAAWEQIAPHALYENNSYGRWLAESGMSGPYRVARDAAELRASGAYPVITPEQLVAAARALGPEGVVTLHPLMGGLEPELAWQSLALVEQRVLPALRESSSRARGSE